MDTVTKKQRSKMMSLIKSKNTKPELKFRSTLWKTGLRGYRVHSKKIFGNPDIYFSKSKLALFIDGCFWHKCPMCYKEPKSNKDYWISKINKNTTRDAIINKTLKRNEIEVIRIWEHEIENNMKAVYLKISKKYDRYFSKHTYKYD